MSFSHVPHDQGHCSRPSAARLVLGDEAERVKDADGKPGYRLTDEGIRLGLTRLEWQAAVYNDRALHGLLRRWIYRDGDLWSLADLRQIGGWPWPRPPRTQR